MPSFNRGGIAIDGLEESMARLEDELEELTDKTTMPAYIINAGLEAAEAGIGRVRLDGDYDEVSARRVKYEKGFYELVIDGNNVDFLEYGTGWRGQQSPHPEADEIGWEYDENYHGEAGWFYYRSAGAQFVEGSKSAMAVGFSRGIVGGRFAYGARRAIEKAILRYARYKGA